MPIPARASPIAIPGTPVEPAPVDREAAGVPGAATGVFPGRERAGRGATVEGMTNRDSMVWRD